MHHRRTLAVAGLASLAVLAHLPSVWSSFLADDYVMLRSVERVTGVTWPFWHNDFGEADDAGHFYRPVWLLWNAGVHALFGDHAAAFHAANLVLFAAITLQVWLLARRFVAEHAALAAAALFAVYPRHSESVAWISGNTDLTATVLALAALLCVLAPWRLPVRLAAALPLAALAALAKEIAFVVPLLALVLLWAVGRRGRDRRTDRSLWLVPIGLAVAQAAVLGVRTGVLGGLGGYYGYDWTARRAIASAASYAVGAVTPAQLDVMRYPVLLVVPAVLASLAAWALVRGWRTGERTVRAALVVGLVWFVLALVPVLNLGLDLTTANGERLLFLPSVGLALAVGGLVQSFGPPARRPLTVAIMAAAAGLALSLHAARNWVVAGAIGDRVVASALRIAPDARELILLSVPESYRNAHVLRLGLDAALERAGLARRTAWCAPVQILEQRRRTVRFRKLADGSYEGRTSWSAPFTFPLSGADPLPLTPDCRYAEGAERASRGRAFAATVYPAPLSRPASYAFFDGYALRPLSG